MLKFTHPTSSHRLKYFLFAAMAYTQKMTLILAEVINRKWKPLIKFVSCLATKTILTFFLLITSAAIHFYVSVNLGQNNPFKKYCAGFKVISIRAIKSIFSTVEGQIFTFPAVVSHHSKMKCFFFRGALLFKPTLVTANGESKLRH